MNNKRDEWEIRDDARSLARAEEIKADPQRYKEAVTMAKKMIADEQKQLRGMKKVAGQKVAPIMGRDTNPAKVANINCTY